MIILHDKLMELESTETIDWWPALAGIGMFLFGLMLMEQAIQHLAGRSFKLFLKNQTRHPAKAVFAGIFVTALLQSSSIVNLLLLAFVGARVLSLNNAMAVILGANLGSTVYTWIVVLIGFKFDIQAISYPIIAIATIGIIFFPNNKKVMHWTRLAFGIALSFIGLSTIKNGFTEMVNAIDITALNAYGNLAFVLAGFLITAIVQSSATTVVIALAALHSGALGFEAAACLVIGSESGTSVKTLIGSIGGIPAKKQMALGNLLINLVASSIAFIALQPLIKIVAWFVDPGEPLISLVAFQTAINVFSIVLFYPFLKQFSKWLSFRYVDDHPEITRYINKMLLQETDSAIKALKSENFRLLVNTIELNRRGLEINHEQATDTPEQQDELIPGTNKKTYSDYYEMVKHLNGEIIDFSLELQKQELTGNDTRELHELAAINQHTMNAAKSVKDIRHNVKDFRESADDIIHTMFETLKKSEAGFYTDLSEFIQKNTKESAVDLLPFTRQINKKRDELIHKTYELSAAKKIKDIELSTLLNVIHEIHGADESLIAALKVYYHFGENGKFQDSK
ncbi:MAG: Na/Pi cotransporter family protein [Bacteroidetes bacterium]|nr:Na/Pi cotransporter family protein [Bacteroidota bacterium]